jgi:hypothetical protein
MDLLTNAIESIRVGVVDYESNERPRLLSAVRNIHAGILLLFKEKLRRLSPRGVLMMAKIVPARNADGNVVFVGAGRKTADVEQIRERFKALGITADWARFDKINEVRNDIEHLFPRMDQKALQGLISNSFLIIRDFLSDELNRNPRLMLGEAIWQTMLTISDVYEAHSRECAALVAQAKWSSEVVKRGVQKMACQQCSAGLLKPYVGPQGQTYIYCDACGSRWSPAWYEPWALQIALYSDEVDAAKEGRERLYRACPACTSGVFVFAENKCTVCGFVPGPTCVGCGKAIEAEKVGVAVHCAYCTGLLPG